eukprot:gene14317-15806_t
MNIRGMAATRPFIKRWFSVVLSLLFFFFVVIVFMKGGNIYDGLPPDRILTKNFLWLDLNNETHAYNCRNSVQGRNLIADDKGYICSHEHLNTKGCCIPGKNSSERFSCGTCKQNRCCKRHILENVLIRERKSKSPLLRSVSDTFELCLSKCRTSSMSVQQENLYRDSVYKFCYGLDLPDLQVIR